MRTLQSKHIHWLVHVAAWGVLLGQPLFFTGSGSRETITSFEEYVHFLVMPLSFMVVFYANYLWLIPRTLFSKRIGRFVLGNVLLIGADNWLAFDKWRNPEEILAHHEVWVYGRPGLTVDAGSLPRGVRLLGAPLLEVSSTFIRESVARGRDVRYYTHPAVWEIIEKHELYR